MKMYEYGNRSKPHILLIHGMWMSHEMLLLYMDDGFLEEYHILAPDLTGHGSNHGQFISAKDEAKKIESWLAAEGITELDLMFSASMGGVVAMYLAAGDRHIRVKCSVMEGASITRVPMAEPVFLMMLNGMRKHPEKLTQMYTAVPLMDSNLQSVLFDAVKRTDDQSLRNMVHTCNSYAFEACPLDARTQKALFFEFGSRDTHIVCRRDIKRFYPYATVTVRKGYGHCTYLFEHGKEYPAILRGYMARARAT